MEKEIQELAEEIHNVCSKCNTINSMRSNKVEISIGDKGGSVADVAFEYCEECGHRGDIYWWD